MEGERKGNTAMLTVIAIATLLVAVVGATFAYFSASTSGNAANVTVSAETKAADVFSSVGTPNVSLTVTAAQMQKSAGKDDHTVVANSANADGNVTVSLTAGSGTATCTYDVIYTPGLAFTTSEAVLAKEALTNKKELVLDGDSSINANDFSDISLAGLEGTPITLKSGATISDTAESGDTQTATTETWTFTAKFYNLGTDQSDNADSTFSGNITIQNVSCTNSAS